MGMFDYVKCDRPLPDGGARNPHDDHFQTKDLGCELATFRITEDGKLVCEADGMFTTESGPRDDFHGILNFYTCNSTGGDWREYNAKFTDGQCVGIERAE